MFVPPLTLQHLVRLERSNPRRDVKYATRIRGRCDEASSRDEVTRVRHREATSMGGG